MTAPTARLRLTFETNGELLELFHIAETLGKTVDQLLTGEARPISPIEVIYWRHYFRKKAKLEEEAQKKNGKASTRAEPKMMGK